MMPEINTHTPILYVDDEKANLTIFNSTFKQNYKVYMAKSGPEGLKVLEENEVHLVIADLRMPGMTGIDFLEKVKLEYPDCMRIMVSGIIVAEAVVQAINKGGVFRYITKPWKKDDLKTSIDLALETFYNNVQNEQLIDDLKDKNLKLEKKVLDRTLMLEEQGTAIMDSIHYASRIQSAMLPEKFELDSYLPAYFLMTKPKDIVSGDYYWISRENDKVIVAVADCTGHGIPGAFMSILGISILNEIVHEAEQINAGVILSQLRTKVIRALRQTGRVDEARDGMEISLCVIDFKEKKLQYSGAFRPLYLVREKDLQVIKGDSMPIGKYDTEDCPFNSVEVVFEEKDMVYMSSDGFVDQLGGPHRKTYRSRKFKTLLTDIHQKPLLEQKEILEKEHEAWKQDEEQIDDITVLGFSFDPLKT